MWTLREVEGMPDHVHLLASIPLNVSLTSVIGKIKNDAAKVLRDEFPILKRKLPCLWTRGKFVASAGHVTLEVLKAYVAKQKGV